VARKFLYFVAAIIGLIIVAGIIYALFGAQLIRTAMVPSVAFKPQISRVASAYAPASAWIARPDIPDNPSQWLPAGIEPVPQGKAAIFFVHPTSYLNRSAWNAPADDTEANDRAALFVRGQASVFTAAGQVWAPRYRQATFGAFLTDREEGKLALDAAYRDVAMAFDHFLASIKPDQPIILAGHSQGSLHLLRLLNEKVARTPIAKRVVAAYVVGWPVSHESDLPALGLKACGAADDAQCILSWQSYAEPADTSSVETAFDSVVGLNGKPHADTKIICTNPLNGTLNASAPADANDGVVKPSADLKTATLIRGAVGARCSGRGFLLIGDPPAMGPYVLPGNNYHVYDYSLFWSNVRADAVRRLVAFERR
jgi:hypothetical protein